MIIQAWEGWEGCFTLGISFYLNKWQDNVIKYFSCLLAEGVFQGGIYFTILLEKAWSCNLSEAFSCHCDFFFFLITLQPVLDLWISYLTLVPRCLISVYVFPRFAARSSSPSSVPSIHYAWPFVIVWCITLLSCSSFLLQLWTFECLVFIPKLPSVL